MLKEMRVADGIDIPAILGYGIIGLGFLLALLTFRLLTKEQGRESSRPGMLQTIWLFMVFSVALTALGLLAEILKPPAGENPETTRALRERIQELEAARKRQALDLLLVANGANQPSPRTAKVYARIIHAGDNRDPPFELADQLEGTNVIPGPGGIEVAFEALKVGDIVWIKVEEQDADTGRSRIWLGDPLKIPGGQMRLTFMEPE